jgi:hypothetical protein
MANPFAKFTTRDWLYVGGAVASIVALMAYLYHDNTVAIPGGVQTDVQNNTGAGSPGWNGVNYLNYNTGGPSLPVPEGADTAPSNEAGCCCGTQRSECAGQSSLATGDTFGGLNDLLTYYQNTNPTYVELQKVQMQQYADYFAAGQTYSQGGVAIGVSGPIG